MPIRQSTFCSSHSSSQTLRKEQDRGRGLFRLTVQHVRPHTHMSAAIDSTNGNVLVTSRPERCCHVLILLPSPILVAIRIEEKNRRQIRTQITRRRSIHPDFRI